MFLRKCESVLLTRNNVSFNCTAPSLGLWDTESCSGNAAGHQEPFVQNNGKPLICVFSEIPNV